MPGSLGNLNHSRHGLRGSRLPKGCSYILKSIDRFRRDLEAAVIAQRDELTLTDIAIIQTAYRWERHAQLCARWLATEEKLTAAERIAFSRDVARASSERDRCLVALRLDRRSREDAALDAFYSGPEPADAESADEPTSTSEAQA